MKNFIQFLKSLYFAKHLLMALATVFIVVGITLLSVNIYTHHGNEQPVPDFKGKTLEQTLEVIKDNHLRYEIIDSVFTTEVARGAVVDQNPPAGFFVKRKRTIFLTINAFNPEMVAMPKVTDMPLNQAQSDLASYGLKIGKLIYVDDYYRHYIRKQYYKGKEIEAGEKIEKGSRIDFELGAGFEYDEQVMLRIPSLYGLTLDEAYQKATAIHLNINDIQYDSSIKTDADKYTAVVYKQEPPIKYKTSKLGHNITVWMTVNKIMAAEAKLKAESAPPPLQNEADSLSNDVDESENSIF